MEPLRLVVISDPTGDIAKFNLGMRETVTHADGAQLAVRRVNTEIASMAAKLSAAQSALSGSGGFKDLAASSSVAAASIAKQAAAERDLAQASATLKVSSGLLAESEAKIDAIRAKSSITGQIAKEREASRSKDATAKAAQQASIAEERLNQVRAKSSLDLSIKQEKADAAAKLSSVKAAQQLSKAYSDVANAAIRNAAATKSVINVSAAKSLRAEAVANRAAAQAAKEKTAASVAAATAGDKIAASAARTAKAQTQAVTAELRLSEARKRSSERAAKQISDADKFIASLEKEVVSMRNQVTAVGLGASGLKKYEAALLGVSSKSAPLIAEQERLREAMKRGAADKAARDYESLAAATPKAATALKTVEVELQKIAVGAEKGGASFRKLVTSQQSLDLLKAKIASVEKEIRTLPVGSEAARKSLERLARLNLGFDKINNEISSLKSNLSGAGDAARKTSGIFSSAESKILAAAGAYLGLRNAIEQVKKSISTFSGFDDAIRIASSYGGVLDATSQSFYRLSEAAKTVGRDTSLSATEAAAGLTELASKGFSATEQLALLPKEVALAESAQISLKDATATTISVLKAYKVAVEDAGKANDIITYTANNSGANVLYLKEAFSQALTVGQASGETFETVAASLAVFGDRAIPAGVAQRNLRNIIISMKAPTASMRAEWERLGVSVNDQAGKFRGLIPIMEDLGRKNISVTESSKLFGRFQAAGGVILSQGVGKVKELTSAYDKLNGVTEDTAKFQQEGLGGSLRILAGSIDLLYNEVGGNLAPAFTDLSAKMTEFTNDTSKVTSTTKILIGTARALANAGLGIYSAFDIAADGITGLISTGLNLNPIYRSIELILSGLKKIGLIDDNPLENFRKSAQEFADAQDGSLQRMEDRASKLNKTFDKYSSLVDKNAANKKKAAAADKAAADAADKAATAAATAARAQGETASEAVKIAAAARKAYVDQELAATKLAEKEARLESSARRTREEREKEAEAARGIAAAAGFSASEADAAAKKILEASKKTKTASKEVTEEMRQQAVEIENSAGKFDLYTSKIGKISELERKIKLAKQQVSAFGRASDLGRAALNRLATYDIEKSNLKGQVKSLKKELGGATSGSADLSAAISELQGNIQGGGEAADMMADGLENIQNINDGLTPGGIDTVNSSLEAGKKNADAMSLSVSKIGSGGAPEAPSTPSGGAISFTADINLEAYNQKSKRLKDDVDSFKQKHLIDIQTTTPEFEPVREELRSLETAHAKAQAEFVKQQGIDTLNSKLKETRTELAKTFTMMYDRKLRIDTDPEASNQLKAQVRLANDAKLAAGAMGEGFEYVNGVLVSMSPAASAAKAAYDGLADSSGNIKTEWVQVGETWREVLPSGESLIDNINRKVNEGAAAATNYGESFGFAFAGVRTGSEGVDKILSDLEGKFTGGEGESLKFIELKDSIAAAEVLKSEIKGLEAAVKEFGAASAEGQGALNRLLTAEAEEGLLKGTIKELKDEIYSTGEEAKSTGKKASAAANEIAKIPSATSEAASAVDELSAANENLEQSTKDVSSAVRGTSKSFTVFSQNSVEGINNQIASLKIEQKAIEDMNEIIGKSSPGGGRYAYEANEDFYEAKLRTLEEKKFGIEMDSYMKSKGLGGEAGDLLSSTQSGTSKKGQQAGNIVNNYNYAVPVSPNSMSQQSRLTAQA